VWRQDPGGSYTVRSAYNLLTHQDVQDAEATTYLIWHKHVSLKASVLAWRLLFNRLPTKYNVVRRHIITHYSNYYVTSCEEVETAQHLFLSFPVFAHLWSLIRTWVDISSADPFLIRDHFVQFTHAAGGSQARRSFLQLLWLCGIWVLWHERNSRIFKANESNVHQMIDKVKVHSL
jgi:hypothetical protein